MPKETKNTRLAQLMAQGISITRFDWRNDSGQAAKAIRQGPPNLTARVIIFINKYDAQPASLRTQRCTSACRSCAHYQQINLAQS